MSELTQEDLPDPEEEPIRAADIMIRHTRTEMSGELYDENEEVREWASNLEWAYTALSEHENPEDVEVLQ